MSQSFVDLLVRLKELISRNEGDIHSLKEHCQLLTEQFRETSKESEERSSPINSSQLLLQAHPIRVQVNHHPQSAFKPIKPQPE